jgi:topoisomerase IA-like protein
MDWLRRLFGLGDETAAHARDCHTRVRAALDQIAGDWEAAADRNRRGLGLDPKTGKALPAAKGGAG